MACNKPEAPHEEAVTDSVVAVLESTGPKACELLSNDDIKQVTGVEYKPGETTNDYGGDSQCQFVALGDSSSIMVSLHAHGDLSNYARVPGATAVTAIVDSAVWNADIGQIAVKHGAAVLSVSLMNQTTKQKTAEQLARRALRKL